MWHRDAVEALSQLTSFDEDTWRLLLDEIPVGIGIAEPVEADGTVRPEARIVYYNRRWVEMFGFDVGDVETFGQATRRLYPDPEVHASMMRMRYAAAGRLRSNGGSEQTEIRAMGANGEWLDVITGTTVVGDRLVVTMLDITERKRTARKLEETRQSLENSAFEITENIPAGTYTMVQPPKGGFARFTFLSSRFLEMCGLTREVAERDPLNVYALVHPEDHDDFLRKNIETFERKVPFSEEFRVIIRGETRWFHGASNPRSLPDGSTAWEGVLTDITARKKAERKLRDALMNLPIPVAVGTNDEAPRIALVNKAFTETFGYTQEEIPTVQRWIELAYPDPAYRAEVMARWEKSLPGKPDMTTANVTNDVRIHCKDGSVRDAIFSTTLTADGPIVAFQDITLRKKADQARAEADRSMKLAASAARLGFWEIDIATRLDRWDAEMARIHGIRHEDFDGHWEKFVHPDDYDEVMRETRRMLESDTVFEMEYRIVRRSGEIRFIREHGIVVRDQAGRALSASGVMQDITERRQAEEEIRASTQRMRLAASAAGLGFWSRNNDTGLEEWDDEMLRIYGVRREDFDGRWEPFVHPEDATKVQRLSREAAASGHVGEYEYRIIRPDGTVRHLRGRSTFVQGADGRAAREIGVNFDITAQKEAAERESRLQADHRSDLEKKLKTSLSAAVVAHEVNQPLSAILLDTQVALERLQGDTPELAHARKFLCSTIAHATRAVETIGKVSTLLRSVPTTPQEVNLVDVVRSAALYAKDDLRTAGIALDTTGTGRAVKIRGDEGQLLLAVSNLLRNAIQALRSDDGGRPREIVIALTRHTTFVILSVADSGPGLPPNILAKIPLHTTKPDGTGLGLFIVQTVAENHGATLEAGPSKLGGAELRLVFPAAK